MADQSKHDEFVEQEEQQIMEDQEDEQHDVTMEHDEHDETVEEQQEEDEEEQNIQDERGDIMEEEQEEERGEIMEQENHDGQAFDKTGAGDVGGEPIEAETTTATSPTPLHYPLITTTAHHSPSLSNSCHLRSNFPLQSLHRALPHAIPSLAQV